MPTITLEPTQAKAASSFDLTEPEEGSLISTSLVNPAVEFVNFADLQPSFSSEKGTIFAFPSTNPGESLDVFINEETVIVKTVRHSTGQSKTNKTWHSWKVLDSTIFSLKRDRFEQPWLRVYSTSNRSKGRGSTIYDMSTNKTMPASSMRESSVETYNKIIFDGIIDKSTFENSNGQAAELFAVWALLKKYQEKSPEETLATSENLLRILAYPTLKMFGGKPLKHLDEAVRLNSSLWLVEPNPRTFLAKALGKDAVRKDFMKALANVDDIYGVTIASYLRGLVPVDWFLPLLREPEKFALSTPSSYFRDQKINSKSLKKLFRNASIHQRKRMISFPADNSYQNRALVRDALNLLDEVPEDYLAAHVNTVDFTSWKSIHDTLRLVRHNVKNKPLEIKPNKLAKKLDKASYTVDGEKYTIVAPTVSSELVTWGDEMVNCIAGYGRSAAAGSTNVFAVYNKNKMFANIEIRETAVVQFMMKYNRSAPEEHRKAVEKLVSKKN